MTKWEISHRARGKVFGLLLTCAAETHVQVQAKRERKRSFAMGYTRKYPKPGLSRAKPLCLPVHEFAFQDWI